MFLLVCPFLRPCIVQMWVTFAFSWLFILKRNLWRTNNVETINVICFPLYPSESQKCYFFWSLHTSTKEEVLKIFQYSFRFWFLRNFLFGIFVFKSLNGSILEIWGTQSSSMSKMLNFSHSEWLKTKWRSLCIQLIVIVFEEEYLKNKHCWNFESIL